MEEIILECESDAPADWENNVILRRSATGEVYEVIVPDDEEVAEDAANN